MTHGGLLRPIKAEITLPDRTPFDSAADNIEEADEGGEEERVRGSYAPTYVEKSREEGGEGGLLL